MAQDFVGANNVPLLVPAGQFGTRAQGGKNAAQPRYIFTHLAPTTRRMFCEDDDAVLEYLKEDSMSIEPRVYYPVVPTLLINGCEGIGTGWSTSIPHYNPQDVAAAVEAWIAGDAMPEMIPW